MANGGGDGGDGGAVGKKGGLSVRVIGGEEAELLNVHELG